MSKQYLIMTSTDDGPELWSEGPFFYNEGKEEIKKATSEFGGKYWMEETQGENPLSHIPDTNSHFWLF